MAIVQHSVSLDDADATRDELAALRDVMRSDAPFPDEPPVLDADGDPWDDDRWQDAILCDAARR
jgi:hypothetical protein